MQPRLGDYPFSLALFQAMLALRRTEKGRQGQTGQAFEECGQVPEYGFDAIIQRQCDHLHLLLAQALLAIKDLGIQRGVIQFQLIAPQRSSI
ncbi:hypothetical protein D3C87_1229170 [compost metagenome]